MHTNHPLLSSKEMPVSIRDLTPEQAQIISDVDNAFTNLGVAGNIIFKKYGLALPRSRIRCITGFEHGVDDEGNFVLSPKDKSKGDGHQLIQFLCEKKYDHVIMYHRLVQSDADSERKSELVNYYDYQSTQQESAEELSFGTTTEQQEIHQFALEQRRALRCHPDDLVMIGIAWVTPHERRLFRMFPEVLKTDCTASTNNENRPFFAASGMTSDHGVFVAVRAFLPNERCWTFRWLFQKVFIQLLGTAMQRCNMIITDGDSQEIRTLDSSLEDDSTQMYYRNVHRQRCCWHLISRTWQRYLPKFPGWKAQVCTNIRQWLYSFCESNAVESQSEYDISRALLREYINSKPVVDLLGPDNIKDINTVISNSIESEKDHAYMMPRFCLRHFDEYTNSSCEGNFSGMKNGAASVSSTHSLLRATETLSFTSEYKAALYSQEMGKAAKGTYTWNPKITLSNDLVPYPALLLEDQNSKKEHYQSCRSSANTWLVTDISASVHERIVHLSPEELLPPDLSADPDGLTGTESNPSPGVSDTPTYIEIKSQHTTMYRFNLIPRFHRVRNVTVENNTFRCSCCFYDRFGLPCRHILHVMELIPGCELSIGDVDIRWTKLYKRFAYPIENSDNVRDATNLINQAIELRASGPQLRVPLPGMPSGLSLIPDIFHDRAAHERCKNHDAPKLLLLMRKYHSQNEYNAPWGIESQVSIFTQDDESWAPGHFPDDGNAENMFDNEEPTFPVAADLGKCGAAYFTCKPRFDECCKLAQDIGEHAVKELADLLDRFRVNLTLGLTQKTSCDDLTPHEEHNVPQLRSAVAPSCKRKNTFTTKAWRAQCMKPTKQPRKK
jgi:MULE transposase domain/SWIM zinc finger